MPPHDVLELENEQLRVVRFSYGKGDSSPMHDHPAGLVILLAEGKARLTMPDGKTAEVNGQPGVVKYRPALSHALENLGDRFVGIHVDLKGAPSGK